MISKENINRKAFQELILYYLEKELALKILMLNFWLLPTSVNSLFLMPTPMTDFLLKQDFNKTIQ